jgi:hypothetical protein
LADYELLLFQAIPRRDVKPIVKALIERFGGFAEAVDDHSACRIDRMNQKDRLGGCRFRAWLPHNRDRPNSDHFLGTYVPVGGPSTASLGDMRSSVSAPPLACRAGRAALVPCSRSRMVASSVRSRRISNCTIGSAKS